MYSVCVRDHLMVAHSFRGDVFGPAQALHGATFVVDVEFPPGSRRGQHRRGHHARRGRLRAVLADLNYRNLDDVPAFKGLNTTTEFLSKKIFDAMAAAIRRGGDLGAEPGVESLRVTLHESHVAWAAFEGGSPEREITRPAGPWPHRHPYGRLRLRSTHCRGPVGAWMGGRRPRAARQLPVPTAQALADAGRVLSTIDDDAIVLADGLAFGAMPAKRKKKPACGSSRWCITRWRPKPASARPPRPPLEASERRALATARRVVVTSATADGLGRYGVGEDRIDVVEPGTDPAPLAADREGGPAPAVRGRAGAAQGPRAAVPRAGLDTSGNWRLTCVGSLERDPGMAETLRTLARTLNLDGQIVFAGEATAATLPALCVGRRVRAADALRRIWNGRREALARGLPVVSTNTGAIAELVGGTAGIVVAPGDVQAFAQALSSVLNDDSGVRQRLAAGARQVRDTLPTWDDAASRMEAALIRVPG